MSKKKIGVCSLLVILLCLGMSMTAFAAKKGWYVQDAKTYYYDEDGTLHRGWLVVDGYKYFMNKRTGAMSVGKVKIGTTTYYFNSKGVLRKVYPNAKWHHDSKGYWYDNGDGTFPKNKWETINGKRYRFGKKGYAYTGWKKIRNTWYCFGKKGAMYINKWIRGQDKKQYYVGNDGKMMTDSWIGDRYVDENGVYIPNFRDDRRTSSSKTGWVGYSTKWRYYYKGGLVTGWRTIKKHTYYFGPDGYMKIGWLKKGGEWYLLETRTNKPDSPLGCMLTGLKRISGKYYYFFDKDVTNPKTGKVYKRGTMAKSISLKSGDIVLRFDENGVCTNFEEATNPDRDDE